MIDPAWLHSRFPELTAPRPLGQGGQKEVFLVQHPREGEVVLKLFGLGADKDRLLREIKAAQDLSGQRVPQVYDFGTTPSPLGEVLWLREAYVPGESVRAEVRRGPLSDERVLRLALHVLEPLAAAEQARIVHRDVKPENVVAANDGTFWLIDFGLARHLDLTSLTGTALPFGMGTIGYSPPEQLRNLKPEIDARSDLFALGVTLYEAVEGVNPFIAGARDAFEVLRRSENNPLPPISRDIGGKEQMRDLVLAMTRTQREHRPDSAAEALAWIREICASEGIG